MNEVKHLAVKLKRLEPVLFEQFPPGTVRYIGLFHPKNQVSWDILVSATWMDKNEADGIGIVDRSLKNVLTQEENRLLSRIVAYPFTDEIPEEFIPDQPLSDSVFTVSNEDFNQREIKKAYIITAA